MKKLILIFVSLFVIAGYLQAQEKTKTDSLVLTKLYSKVLGEERKVVVHLPLNYSIENTKKYPVMFVLDAGKLDFDVSDRLFTLSSSGIAPECIVVGILNNKGTRERDLTPPFMQTETEDTISPLGKGGYFLEFIQNELIPLIDSSYRTSGYQTITGHSRAGLFVLYTLLERPNLFNARFCFSTPAWRFDNMIIKRLENNLHSQQYLNDSYLYLSVGENENPNIKASFHTLNELLKKLNSKHLNWDSYLTPLANHQTNPVLSTAKAMVCWSEYLRKKTK